MDECPTGPCCCGGVGCGCLADVGCHLPGAHMPNVFLVALRTKLRTKHGIKVRNSCRTSFEDYIRIDGLDFIYRVTLTRLDLTGQDTGQDKLDWTKLDHARKEYKIMC